MAELEVIPVEDAPSEAPAVEEAEPEPEPEPKPASESACPCIARAGEPKVVVRDDDSGLATFIALPANPLQPRPPRASPAHPMPASPT